MDLLTRNGYAWPSMYPSPMAHQRVTAEFLVHNKRSLCLNGIGCVDAETEYLTRTGWKRIDRYDGGEVAQYNLNTSKAEFVAPSEYIKIPACEFYHIKTNYGIDQMLTPEHRVLYVKETGGIAVDTMQHIAENHRRTKTGFRGRIITTFKAPDTKGIPVSDDALRLYVAIIADSNFPAGNNTNSCHFRLRKRRKIRRLKQLLLKNKLVFSDRKCKPVGFRRISFDAPIKKKSFDDFFWDANTHQMEVIADESTYWDGHFTKSVNREFFSTDKASVDFIQYCFIATGKVTSISTDSRENRNPVYHTISRNNDKPLYVRGTSAGSKCRYDNIKKIHTPWAYK